jgi:RimJ/RimL family protein N-acetyltransferase
MLVEKLPTTIGGVVQLFAVTRGHVTEEYVSWLNDPVTSRFLESRFYHHTPESVREYVEQCHHDPAALLLGVRSTTDGRHVGNVKLAGINRHHGLVELGILIGQESARGRGLGTAAILEARRVARELLGLRRMTAGCYASNQASQRAFLRAGFTIDGIRRGHFLLDGRPEDFVLLSSELAFNANPLVP